VDIPQAWIFFAKRTI